MIIVKVPGCFVGSRCFFFFKQKTAYEVRISDLSLDVCSADLLSSILTLAVLLDSPTTCAWALPTKATDARSAAAASLRCVFNMVFLLRLRHPTVRALSSRVVTSISD